MEATVIDWSNLSAERAFKILLESPRIAGVWQYSDMTRGYHRNLLWDPKKGSEVTWLTVARVWPNTSKKVWYASYAYDGDEYQRRTLGPFEDRFAAGTAIDTFLEDEGWKVCK